MSLIISATFSSCSDDLTYATEDKSEINGEIPVTFDFEWPEEIGTRAYIDEFGNERFENLDAIHVLGTFNTKSLNENGDTIYGVVKRYGVLTYDGRNWTAEANNKSLTWPAIATDGEFIAYFISGSNGALTQDQPIASLPLSNLTSTTDPLTAHSSPGIPYGNAVRMEFSHICAQLTLLDIEPQVSDAYWMIRDGDLTDQNGNSVVFNNAFQLKLGLDSNGNPDSLDFSFMQMQNPNYNEIFIAGNVIVVPPGEENPLDPTTLNVEYYLQPGYYDTFKIVYPVTSGTTYGYLEYDYNKIPESASSSPVPPLLDANTPYTLDITKSPGTTIVSPPTGEGWDDNGDYTIIVDVEDFLKQATSGNEYYQDGLLILEKTATGCRLMKNISFNNFSYSDFKDTGFLPIIGNDIIFDGNLHYIKDLVQPLFHFVLGTVENLGIQNVNADIISEENDDDSLDNSRNGVFCHYNTGVLSNLRLIDATLNVQVKSYIDANATTNNSETHNIGGIAGSNIGMIDQVAFGGTLTINVTGVDNNVNATVLVGGVTGQNASGGTVENIEMLDNYNRITITNSCIGSLGDYAFGGVVGQSGGYIQGVFLENININCSQSRGVTSYLGGIAGNLDTQDNPGALASCSVSGNVIAGVTEPFKAITSGSYSGGIAGVVVNIPVTDCNTAVSVTGPVTVNNNVTYATGGAFGRIRDFSINYVFNQLTVYGSTLTGPQYIGNFAGIVPNTTEWNDWYSGFSTHNIFIRRYTGLNDIGTQM